MLPRHRLGTICLLAANLLAAGCIPIHSTTAPDPAPAATAQLESELSPRHRGKGWENFYPLHVGNRWTYSHTGIFEFRHVGDQSFRDSFHTTIESRQTCEEMVAGRRYVIERQLADGGEAFWLRFRQDRAGLYELDEIGPPSCEEPPIRARRLPGDAAEDDLVARLLARVPVEHRAAWAKAAARNAERMNLVRDLVRSRTTGRRGGIAPGELQRLQYPLRPGSSWVVRNDPLFTSEVVRHESLVTPAGRFSAYRIRGQSELFEPRDRVHFWFSREGLLQIEAHLESITYGDAGNVVGVFVSDERQTLTGLSLVGRRPRDDSEGVASAELFSSGW